MKSWTDIIEKYNGYNTEVKFVCEKHFIPQDIIRSYVGVEVF